MKAIPHHILTCCLLLCSTLPASLVAQEVNKVVIDAGHGGHDPGNLGTRRYKTTEKDIALAVALKVGEYINEHLPEVEVIYTRKSDKFVDLIERAEIANRNKADLFISIHCDAFNSSTVHGATTLVLGRNHDDDNLRVAMQENSVILLEEDYQEKYEGFDPNKPESYIAFTLYQSAFINQSISFAQKVQDQFRERVSRRDRGVKQQPLMVTKMATMPSVLIELGFLTNPSEEDFLNSEKGQAYMASAIFRAFRNYREEREKMDRLSRTNSDTDITTSQIDPPKTVTEKPDTQRQQTGGEPAGEPAESLYYSVQIATSVHKRDMSPEHFNGVEGISMYRDGGLYKYIVGNTRNLEEARSLQTKMKARGFNDAFVIALKGGKRISIGEARQLLE